MKTLKNVIICLAMITFAGCSKELPPPTTSEFTKKIQEEVTRKFDITRNSDDVAVLVTAPDNYLDIDYVPEVTEIYVISNTKKEKGTHDIQLRAAVKMHTITIREVIEYGIRRKKGISTQIETKNIGFEFDIYEQDGYWKYGDFTIIDLHK